MPIRKLWLLVTFIVILGICAASWFFLKGETIGPGASPHQGELRQAPDFSLKDRAGRVHTMQEMRGKMVLVHFWAAWCPPCLSEIPELVEFAEHFKNEPKLEIVAISLDETWDAAEKVLQTEKLPKNMISLLDGGAKISDAYGTYQFPETYLVNPEGRIVAKWVGGQPWASPKTEDVMKQEIEKAR